MPDERARILELLREGKISVEEAERLLDALGPASAQAEPVGEAPPGGWPGAAPRPRAGRRLHIRITDLHTGRIKTDVRVPFGAWAFLRKRTRTRLGRRLSRLGITDIERFVQAGRSGRIVDITDERRGERVEIILE